MKHNNVIPNGHFKKQTDIRVKTWFNQTAHKQMRRIARQEMAVKIPQQLLELSTLLSMTLKYNMKVRSGRGFFSRNFRNRSPEELQADVGECAPEELATATQVDAYMPVVRDKPSVDLVKVTEDMKSFNAYTSGTDECALRAIPSNCKSFLLF
uniref:Uncharacterized protein n=1 Tax=Solanum lycopersicum TaxID=4081 RepID=A0A3Q7HV98_SOLLC